MEQIRYIHAADLHLDSPFTGLGKTAADWAARLKNAPYDALARLVELCRAHNPHFVVFAGDLYDHEEKSIKGQLAMRDACAALARLSIPVFIVHGNHDPAPSLLKALKWPENTIIFGPQPEKHLVMRDGAPLAMIHGASHASAREERNLAALLRRDADFSGFQLGLLHCNVDGAVAEDRYAPCSIADLRQSGLDAWALGHAHARRILCEAPFAAYAGNTQGLRANETGPKGCLLTTATSDAAGWNVTAEFHELGPVRWEKADVDVDNATALDDLEDRMEDVLRESAEGVREAMIISLNLTGRTSLAQRLSQEEVLEELGARLENCNVRGVDILPRQIRNSTAPLIAEDGNLDRDDLIGEVARVAKALEDNPQLLDAALAQACRPLARAVRSALAGAEIGDARMLLAQARRACQDLLEKR